MEERLFYIGEAARNRWSERQLRDSIKRDDFHHRGAMPSNFMATIPDATLARKTLGMFRDEYLLDFVNLDDMEAADAEDVDERVVEKSIVANIRRFITKKGGRPALPTVSVRASKLLHNLASNLLEGSAAFRGRAGDRLFIASKIVKEKGYGDLERALARECALWGEDAVPVCSALKDACVRSHPFAVFKVVESEWERSFGEKCGREAQERERMDSPPGLV